MSGLQVGFAREKVTPKLGITMPGYYRIRHAEGVRDDLELSALAISCGDTTALMLSLDVLGIPRDVVKDFKESITKAAGIPGDCIYIHGTHIHTGPTVEKDSDEEAVREYVQFLMEKMAQVSIAALEDRKDAKMGWSVGKAPKVAFIRRFRMKDGSVRTNPGINNPDVLAPMGEVDDRVNVLRFDREGAQAVVLVNFGNHPDVVGGSLFSADWPGFLRRTMEFAVPDCRCIVFNGCQGDVNHVNVRPDVTDKAYATDPEARYAFSRYIGRAMAGTVLQEYDKVRYVDVDKIRCLQRTLLIPANQGAPEDMEQAHRLASLHNAGETQELRKLYPGMMYETVVGEALRMVELEKGPAFFEMDLSAIALGNIAFIGLPGEAFTGIGVELKKAPGWELVLPTCLTNGSHGYFPMLDSYVEGGYEARTSRFKAGAAEKMIEEGLKILKEMR